MQANREKDEAGARQAPWRLLYVLVVAFLVVQIFLYWLLTRAYL